MKSNFDWLLLAFGNVVLLWLTLMVNDGLAWWGVSVFTAGLCMVLPVLSLGNRGLVGCALLTGLAGDAQWPTPPGFLTTLFVLGAAAIVIIRPRMGHPGRVQQMALAWLLNGLYFAAFTVWAILHGGAGGAVFWQRVAVDFCLSQIILLPVGLWFFEFEAFLLKIGGLAARRQSSPAGR